MPSIPSGTPDTRSLPRILCLHGGGVNATIFEVQSRNLRRHLDHSFRLVWADGPFFCDPHPDIIGVYGDCAPFRRWLRWLEHHPEVGEESCIEEIGYALRATMEEDDRKGGTGEWVGLMGFSQGAKLAASLLLEQQVREAEARRTQKAIESSLIGLPGIDWRFGILLAGRAPLNNLNPDIMKSSALIGAGELTERFPLCDKVDDEAMLSKPTLHVHGLLDPGLHLHQRMLKEYCKQGTTTLVEWEGAHRIAIKTKDVDRIVGAIYDLAESTGVRVTRTV